MPSPPGFATQQDLLQWVETIAAKHELPRLVRRLVLETGKGVTALDFPASEGTASGGWDGVARASEDAPFVPKGLSVWELSAGRSTNKKADEDFEKRTETPDGSPTASATYVALIPRRWSSRRKWAKEKTALERWSAVRALGVDDVETWLESAPVTHAWLSEMLGLRPYGMQTPGAWWEAWAAETEPPMTSELVLAGRAANVEQIAAYLRDAPRVTTLRAESLEDALAFIAAIMIDDDHGQGTLASRTVFVDEIETWRRLADHERPLVMVARTPQLAAEVRTASRHHVIVPVVRAAAADVALEPLDAASAAAVLESLGLTREAAEETSRLGRRSLTALRRHLAIQPELHTPSWARPPVDRIVRGALLAGSWNDESSRDQEQLSALTGRPYEELREDLTRLAAQDDPFLMRVDRSWTVVSPFDAWRELAGQVRVDDLNRFREVFNVVSLEPDPSFDLAPDERWRASVDGKIRGHSPDLRSGLATTIALLGVFGDAVDAGQGATGAALASALVASVLAAANEDKSGSRWAALSEVLSLLAEGAPDAFLEGVLAGCVGNEPILVQVFRDQEDNHPLFGASSPHSGLLWALERLAWSPQFFAQTVYALARLSEIDPGGRFVNRPPNSLCRIFCPWHPETAASSETRLAVIDELRRRHPEIAWRLMLAILPEPHVSHLLTAAPRFRDWKPAKIEVPVLQFHELIAAIVDRLIVDAGTNSLRWKDLLEKASRTAPSSRAKVRDALGALAREAKLTDEGRSELWDGLRKLLARHREFAEADWALPAAELDAFEAIEAELRPEATLESQAWLFTEHMPELGDAPKLKDGQYDHDGYTTALGDRRRRAVREVFSADGWDGILKLASRSVVPWMVGDALAHVDDGVNLRACIALLESDIDHEHALATSYMTRSLLVQGWDLLDRLLAESDLSPSQKAQLLLQTSDYPKSWKRADEVGEDVAHEYWKRFSPLGLGEYGHVKETTEKLLSARRPAAALRLLTMYVFRKDDAESDLVHLAADALEALLQCDPEDLELRSLQQYDYESAFGYLERNREVVGAERLSRLEWLFLPALGYERNAPTLEAALSENPSFFVEVLSAVYRPHTEPEQELTEDQERASVNAYRLLSSWSRPPGTLEDGSFDGDALRGWIKAVLPLLDDADRRIHGEGHIGNVLAFAPSDPDGTWPCVDVRDLLESLQLQRVERGMRMQLYNNRGTTSRHPEAGGEQERDLVKSYREAAEQFDDRWPRTAALLRAVAGSFEQDAGVYDNDAERRRRGMDP